MSTYVTQPILKSKQQEMNLIEVRPSFLYLLFYRFFPQQVRIGGRNKNKNKIHSDHFPIELKSKETFDWKIVRTNFIFILAIKMAISHRVDNLINLAAVEKT